MKNILQHLEALIFSAEQPVTLMELKKCLEATFPIPFRQSDLEDMLEKLVSKYQAELYAFEILEIGGGYQFLTKAAYHDTVGTLLKQKTKKRLSRAALETLSIVAYKQPVTRLDIELIRGVNSDYSVQKLLEKELVTIVGRSEKPGRPLLYATSPKFMDYFGLKSLRDLPKLRDFDKSDSEIGQRPDIEEVDL